MNTAKFFLILILISAPPAFASTTTDDVCMSHCACSGYLYETCYDACTVDDHVDEMPVCRDNSW